MDFDNLESIKHEGFTGFLTTYHLHESRGIEIPKEKGVYLILRLNQNPPVYLETNPAGRFKDKDPTVTKEVLLDSWVNETQVIYIGKAGSSNQKATLRSRLLQYMDFGFGKPVGHWGGRYIWQLEDAHELQVCWKPTIDESSEIVETRLICIFKERYGKRPFANLKD